MSETPSLTGSLAGLTSLLGNLKGMLQKTDSEIASAEQPIANPVCAWSSPSHDGDLATFPMTRFVTDGRERFLAEQATTRAAMGEPNWKALALNLPSDALAWLAGMSTKEDAAPASPGVDALKLQEMNRAIHSLGTLVRAQAEGEISSAELQKAAHQTLALLGLTTGAVLRKNDRGFYVTSNTTTPTPAHTPVDPSQEATPIEPDPDDAECDSLRSDDAEVPEEHVPPAPSYTPTDEQPKERLRIEWMNNDEVRKAVYDPRQQVIRYYQGATEKPTFVLPTICTEKQFVSFVESLKRVHA